jgi:two-component system sensor histidine kinase FlrB
VVVLDRSGRVADCNPAARAMLGGDLLRERWVDVIRRSFAPRQDDGHEISLVGGQRLSVETRSLDRDGGQVLLLTDLTETRALQDRLSRHQRLTAMGRMMAALAHQIRTPLAAAMLYASNLRDAELPPAQVRKFSARVMERLAHLERQVRDMLVFVRGEVPPGEDARVGELLSEIQAAMEAPLAACGASCETQLLCDPGARLSINRDTVVGAVLNLANNALQASGAGATLRLRLSISDGRLGIAVIDRGPGMSEAVLRQLGEDFFTTRPQGTGLGIAVVRSVARAHGGELDIRSTCGAGTTACLWLPLSAPQQLDPGELKHG